MSQQYPPKSVFPGNTHRDDLIENIQEFGDKYGTEAEIINARAEAFEKAEEGRRVCAVAHSRLEEATLKLGGGSNNGASPGTSKKVQAGSFITAALVNTLWFQAFGNEIDGELAFAIVIILQGLFQAGATVYNNKLAGPKN
jgi:hypothetical protein